MLGIDENKWRVGKTLVFLKDYEIMDQLDKLREEKIVEYVIILQSYFRMCKDLQFFRRFRRQVCRIQGFIKCQVIREAFEELCQATRVIQKYGRRRIYYNLFKTITEEMKPSDEGEAVDKAKVHATRGPNSRELSSIPWLCRRARELDQHKLTRPVVCPRLVRIVLDRYARRCTRPSRS